VQQLEAPLQVLWTAPHEAAAWQVLFSAHCRPPWQVWFAQQVEFTVVQVGAVWHTAAMQVSPVLHVFPGLHGPPSVPAPEVGVPQKPFTQLTPLLVQALAPEQHTWPVAPQLDAQMLLVQIPPD
jgi:hypothetical protein